MKYKLSVAVLLVAIAACAPRKEQPSTRRTVTLLHIADTHAQLESHPELPAAGQPIREMGGYARIKTLVDRVRAEGRPTFFADGGDTFQGSGPAAWSRGEVVVRPLNALGLDVCVPGNWEVVYGPDRFRDLMSRVSCRVLAWNFHETETGKRLFAPSEVIERGGVRVAFVGITDPTTTRRQPPAQVAGLDSTRMEGLREHVAELRRTARPDLVVAVTHAGLTVSRQIAREIPELDVILSGHTHERTERSLVEGKVIVVEPGSLGSFVGRLDVELAPGGGVAGHRFRLLPVDPTIPEDPDVAREVNAALAPHRARANRVVGTTKTPILRYDVLDTSADAFVADVVREVTGADIGLTNGFRFGSPIPAGPITEGDLWNLIPLDTRLKKGWVTGAQLRAYLERELELVFSSDPWKLSGGWGPRVSGMSMTFAALQPPGSRLREVRVDGKPLRDDAKYVVAGCEREGEPISQVCRMDGVHDAEILPLTIHEAFLRYLEKHPTIAPERDGRARSTDLPAEVFSQDEILRRRESGVRR